MNIRTILSSSVVAAGMVALTMMTASGIVSKEKAPYIVPAKCSCFDSTSASFSGGTLVLSYNSSFCNDSEVGFNIRTSNPFQPSAPVQDLPFVQQGKLTFQLQTSSVPFSSVTVHATIDYTNGSSVTKTVGPDANGLVTVDTTGGPPGALIKEISVGFDVSGASSQTLRVSQWRLNTSLNVLPVDLVHTDSAPTCD